ncbi:MAG: hypothetical protein LBE35_04780 [Clostridiales bacterium]|jgi:hypothetical protein|nr:hypothetical protein [Clostridiales bacterium]
MINSIGTNAALERHLARQVGKPQDININFSPNSGTIVELSFEAVFTAGVRLPGGMMSASVYKAESFSSGYPIMLVKGRDVCGARFEVEVNINDIDPNNASFIEMFALDGFLAAHGKPAETTRAAARALFEQETLEGNAFTKFGFVAIFATAQQNEILDSLLNLA